MLRIPEKKTERIPPHLPKEVRQQGMGKILWFSPFLRIVYLTVIFGFLAGIVGGILVDSGQLDRWLWGVESNGSSLGSAVNKGERQVLGRDLLAQKAEKSLVTFYRALGRSETENWPRSENHLGYGFFLTSDGWLATTKIVLAGLGKKEIVALSPERRFSALENILLDPASDLVLVKIAGGNFNVLPFTFDDYLAAGTGLWLPTPEAGLKSTELILGNFFSPKNKDEYVQSSERVYRFSLLKDELAPDFKGLPILTARAEMAGMLLDKSSFVSASVMTSALKSALKTGAITRPYLGIHFMENSWRLRAEGQEAQANRGLTLTAVDKKSPLAGLNLKVGDVIISVGNDQLTPLRPLPNILLDYEPGSTVEIRYLRGGEEKTAEVKLGTVK